LNVGVYDDDDDYNNDDDVDDDESSNSFCPQQGNLTCQQQIFV